MLITINAVNIEKTPKYSVANVSFERDGKAEVRKVMSFGGSANAFNKLVEFKTFPSSVNVTMEKNGKGYWEWKDFEVSGNVGKDQAVKPGGRITGSNYETPDERARRQVYIVRQSSISSAIALAALNSKVKVSVEDILDTAKEFEDYVLDTSVVSDFGDVIK